MEQFRNRKEAGEILATKLSKMELLDNTVVLALPRGGVPVAAEISNKLGVPLDVILVKKIGAPSNSEFAIGAISEGKEAIWDPEASSYFGLSVADKQRLAENTQKKILEQAKKWRKNKKPMDIKEKTVIIVDDGIATGLTIKSAIEFVKEQNPTKIIVASPVASKSAFDLLENNVDQIIILKIPEPFFAVGQWYEDFSEVSDEEVQKFLTGEMLQKESNNSVTLSVDNVQLPGLLIVPKNPKGIIIFAHGSGSTHQSPRNQFVAKALCKLGFTSLLFDLLTQEEAQNRQNVFNIELLSSRLIGATHWVRENTSIKNLPIGYFGASTGAAATIIAAAQDKNIISIVSRGGRVDMASEYLEYIHCPVLLIVGENDESVLKLNQDAKEFIENSQVAVVPGAGHIFEEPGTLDIVVEHASDWFNKTMVKKTDISSLKPHKLVVQEIAKEAFYLTSDIDFQTLAKKLSSAKVVMLGEATHGTEEFYELRRKISKILMKDYGFNFVAVEGDWPDCFRLNKYIENGDGGTAINVMRSFKRWPLWMWANEQVVELIEWMRGKNFGFYGLDVYSLYQSLDIVKEQAKKLEPKLGQKVLEAYSCFDSFHRDEIRYARSLLQWPKGCAEEVVRNLRSILRLRLQDTDFPQMDLFNFQQNAKIIENAEKYYRAMISGENIESWNIRDIHMMDTLDALLRFHGENSKAIVWAHNTHIGDYHATDMVEEGYINLGGIARERYGMDKIFLVGFGTYEGQVLAGRAWGAQPEAMNLPQAPIGTYEHYLHETSKEINSSLFYFKTTDNKALDLERGHRAVGVVYVPQLESRRRHYVPTNLSKRYDAFVFIDRTHALKPISGVSEKGLFPETWPVGF